MIKGKRSFIEHVSRCLGRDKLPAAPVPFVVPGNAHQQYLKDADTKELKGVFRKNSEVNGTAVFECVEADLNTTLLEALECFEKGSVVIGDHDYFREQGVIDAIQKQVTPCYLWDSGRSREENMGNAETAMVGISMAELGLAESGTVILFSHKGAGRSVSLLPTYSITVVKACDLRPRLTQGLEFLENLESPLPASVNFVSGASSTADIELVHVKGVHGPLKIAYVVVG
jgi:L-lactate dehydrogenase complex protein LldG